MSKLKSKMKIPPQELNTLEEQEETPNERFSTEELHPPSQIDENSVVCSDNLYPQKVFANRGIANTIYSKTPSRSSSSLSSKYFYWLNLIKFILITYFFWFQVEIIVRQDFQKKFPRLFRLTRMDLMSLTMKVWCPLNVICRRSTLPTNMRGNWSRASSPMWASWAVILPKCRLPDLHSI